MKRLPLTVTTVGAPPADGLDFLAAYLIGRLEAEPRLHVIETPACPSPTTAPPSTREARCSLRQK